MKGYLPPRGTKHSRRGFLKKGFIGGAILALGGGIFLATRPSAGQTLPPEGLLVLSATEYAVLNALAARFIPSKPGFPSTQEIRVAFACDRILAQVDESSLKELKQLIMLFENALPVFLFSGRTAPFSVLGVEAQEQVLLEWSTSALTLRRTGFNALRGLVMAAYYGSSKTWPAVGYPGPPPGIYDPNAIVWKGGDAKRPFGLGSYTEPSP